MQRISFVGMAIVLIFSSLALINSQNSKIAATVKIVRDGSPGQNIVIMELFTSQGCSSCPPADALLAEYASAHNMNIIPLSFHVDYWNRLGWADPFSNSAYSARQRWYSEHLPKGSVYTPQLIVNGRGEAVGNNRNTVKRLVEKELSEKVSESILVENIAVAQNSISFHYKTTNAGKNDVLNIALVQKQATTNIRAGENEGVTITNHNIVRSFTTQQINNDGSGQISLPPSFKASEYALVVYLQNKNDLTINAAVMKEL